MSKAVYLLWKISNILFNAHIPLLPAIISGVIRIMFGAVIPYSTTIGKNSCIAYGGPGVVLHHRCKIGKNCYIGAGVVIGGTSGKTGVPIIEDNVFIGVGAKILGDIIIQKNSVIGANAVVTKTITKNCLAVGIPARIVLENIDITRYNDYADVNNEDT